MMDARKHLKHVGIVGSRTYPNMESVDQLVAGLPANSVVISGGARGVDRRAEAAARKRGFYVISFFPDWKTHGKAAAAIRNRQIVEHSDCLYAFWDGKSPGTRMTVEMAKEKGIPVFVIEPGTRYRTLEPGVSGNDLDERPDKKKWTSHFPCRPPGRIK